MMAHVPMDDVGGMNREIDRDNHDHDDESSEGDGMDNSEEDNKKMKDEKIVEKFIRTFSYGDYDAEIDYKLSCDRSAILPARPKQVSYNKPDNWRERNQDGLEKMKSWLQEATDEVEVRDQSWGLYCHWVQRTENDAPIVWHESILDDYWHKFEAEIYRRGVTDICDVKFVDVEITKESMSKLVTISSATKSIEDIHFNNANLCEEGIVSLSKLVDVSSKLRALTINHNRINSMESALCLSRALKSHTCIKNLAIDHCDIGSNLEILSVILQSDVKNIYLEYNNIDSLGAVKIAEYLESDPPIRCIDLDHNRLNDDDATLISQALKRNTNLMTIYLQSNHLTSIGVKALLNCVFDSSSLNAISESNHTLLSMFIFSMTSNLRLHGCIDKLLNLNRTQKIFLALQDKDSILKYLANVPVELIPEVLEFTRWVDDQPLNKHLNILYSIMRWWNMPMLYSHH
jgi:hypothetical protein